MDRATLIFIVGTIIVILLSLYIAYIVKRHTTEQNKKYTFTNFLNDGRKMPSFDDIIVGMSFGITMGFVDTVAIWLGVDKLSKYVKGGTNLKAAVGNMYSNLVAISIGSAVTVGITSFLKLDNNQSPIYLNAIGSVIGAAMGIAVSKTLLL